MTGLFFHGGTGVLFFHGENGVLYESFRRKSGCREFDQEKFDMMKIISRKNDEI